MATVKVEVEGYEEILLAQGRVIENLLQTGAQLVLNLVETFKKMEANAKVTTVECETVDPNLCDCCREKLGG